MYSIPISHCSVYRRLMISLRPRWGILSMNNGPPFLQLGRGPSHQNHPSRAKRVWDAELRVVGFNVVNPRIYCHKWVVHMIPNRFMVGFTTLLWCKNWRVLISIMGWGQTCVSFHESHPRLVSISQPDQFQSMIGWWLIDDLMTTRAQNWDQWQ